MPATLPDDKRRIALVLGAVALTAALVCATVLTMGGQDRGDPGAASPAETPSSSEAAHPDRTASSSPSPSAPTPATTAPAPVQANAPATRGTARGTVRALLAETRTVLGNVGGPGTTDVSAFGSVAVDEALAEILAQVQEFEVEGWTQTGLPVVRWVRLVKAGTTKNRLHVRACIDTSDVVIEDANGIRVNVGGPTRSINLYTLRRTRGGWKVADHSFPDRADC